MALRGGHSMLPAARGLAGADSSSILRAACCSAASSRANWPFVDQQLNEIRPHHVQLLLHLARQQVERLAIFHQAGQVVVQLCNFVLPEGSQPLALASAPANR